MHINQTSASSAADLDCGTVKWNRAPYPFMYDQRAVHTHVHKQNCIHAETLHLSVSEEMFG